MKDLKISKELIKNVFNYDIDDFQIVGTNKSTQLRVWSKGCELHLYDSWDVHHFAFKCKEWAMNKGFQIISGLSDEPAYRRRDEKAYAKINYYSEDEIGNREYRDMYFMADTEVEAIIDASNYILNILSNK